MKIMVFIPSYNDTILAHKLSSIFLKKKYVDKILIVDESDDPECIAVAKMIRHKKINVVSRERSGKWAAWRLAFEMAKNYDGLLEVDSDILIKNPDILISSLKNYDVVTAYQEIFLPRRGLGRIISTIYQNMHQKLKNTGKFNMGGQVIAFSNRAVLTFLKYNLFKEPVVADDHVICLAAYVLGLKCTTVECGLRIGLPSTVKEWIKYRSRHKGSIESAERYVALKTGKSRETAVISQFDFNFTMKYFLKSLIKSTHIFAPLFLMFFAITSILPIEDPIKWSKLKSEKIYPTCTS